METQLDEIDLRELIAVVRRRLLAVSVVAAAFVLCAFVYVHLATPMYVVSMKVTPTESLAGNSGNLSSLANIAGIAGLSASYPESSLFDIYLESLRSTDAAQSLLTEDHIVQRLFANEWNTESSQWQAPTGIVESTKGLLKTIIGLPGTAWRVPDAAKLQAFLQENLIITRDRTSSIVAISIEHSDTNLARNLLRVLHESTDRRLREKELTRSNRYIEYLRAKLAETSVVEYRQALVEVIAEQEKRSMIASSDLPFASDPISDPAASYEPSHPRPLLTLLLSAFVGLLVGLVSVFVAERSQSRPDSPA